MSLGKIHRGKINGGVESELKNSISHWKVEEGKNDGVSPRTLGRSAALRTPCFQTVGIQNRQMSVILSPWLVVFVTAATGNQYGLQTGLAYYDNSSRTLSLAGSALHQDGVPYRNRDVEIEAGYFTSIPARPHCRNVG